ncbi:hypothetical protein ACFL6H_06140 [Candidatus Latescibacterota bacterium]
MKTDIPRKGLDKWLHDLLKISDDRRKSFNRRVKRFERRIYNRRINNDRRMQEIWISNENRSGEERRSYCNEQID